MSLKAWHILWLIWFVVSVNFFIVAETYALCTDWRRTLSAAVWSLEEFKAGQPVDHWSAGHFWFIGALLLVAVFLLGHFGFGWWRS